MIHNFRIDVFTGSTPYPPETGWESVDDDLHDVDSPPVLSVCSSNLKMRVVCNVHAVRNERETARF